MNRCGCVCGQTPGCRGHTARAHIESQRDVAGDEHRDQICHRGSGDEQATRIFREAEDLGYPARHLPLDLNRNMIAATAVGVQPRSEHLRDHANGCAAAIDPAHEAGMHIALSIGKHLAHELGMDVGEALALSWRRRLKVRAHSGWNRLPDRALANVLDKAEHVVQHAMSLGAEFAPFRRIGGIEALVRFRFSGFSGFPGVVDRGWQLRHSFSLRTILRGAGGCILRVFRVLTEAR